ISFCLLLHSSIYFIYFSFYYSVDHRDLHSFPTRRSSDLLGIRTSAFRSSRYSDFFDAKCWSAFSELGMRRRLFRRLAERKVGMRSEEHTSELQSQSNLVCRLLLEKKKKKKTRKNKETKKN